MRTRYHVPGYGALLSTDEAAPVSWGNASLAWDGATEAWKVKSETTDIKNEHARRRWGGKPCFNRERELGGQVAAEAVDCCKKVKAMIGGNGSDRC